jgi:hypothetical protein
MEELNDMLSIPEHHVNNSAVFFFRNVKARSIYEPNGTGGFKRATFRAFDDRAGFQAKDRKPPVPDAQHPLHQFALDGLVATHVEDVDELNTSSTSYAQHVCTVAVKGHAPMRLSQVPGDVFRGVYESNGLSKRASKNVFLEPVRILAKVYVVLVAVQVDATAKRWMLQYETVSSSNLNVDPRFATGHPLFRANMNTNIGANTAKGQKIVLRVMELGTIVDTRFGPSEQPQLIVCVHVTPFEATAMDNGGGGGGGGGGGTRRIPKNVWKTFELPDNSKVEKSRSIGVKPNSGLRRLQDGNRPAVTGASVADVEALKQSISEMKMLITELSKNVADGLQSESDALGDLKKQVDDIKTTSEEQEKNAISERKSLQQASAAERSALTLTVREGFQDAKEASEQQQKKATSQRNSLQQASAAERSVLTKKINKTIEMSEEDALRSKELKQQIVEFYESHKARQETFIVDLSQYIADILAGNDPGSQGSYKPFGPNEDRAELIDFAKRLVERFGIDAGDSLPTIPE